VAIFLPESAYGVLYVAYRLLDAHELHAESRYVVLQINSLRPNSLKACLDSKGWIAAPANGSSGITSLRSCIHFLSDFCAILIIKIQSIEALLSRMVGFVVLHLHLKGQRGSGSIVVDTLGSLA
jgi:hypothetical protein